MCGTRHGTDKTNIDDAYIGGKHVHAIVAKERSLHDPALSIKRTSHNDLSDSAQHGNESSSEFVNKK